MEIVNKTPEEIQEIEVSEISETNGAGILRNILNWAGALLVIAYKQFESMFRVREHSIPVLLTVAVLTVGWFSTGILHTAVIGAGFFMISWILLFNCFPEGWQRKILSHSRLLNYVFSALTVAAAAATGITGFLACVAADIFIEAFCALYKEHYARLGRPVKEHNFGDYYNIIKNWLISLKAKTSNSTSHSTSSSIEVVNEN